MANPLIFVHVTFMDHIPDSTAEVWARPVGHTSDMSVAVFCKNQYFFVFDCSERKKLWSTINLFRSAEKFKENK